MLSSNYEEKSSGSQSSSEVPKSIMHHPETRNYIEDDSDSEEIFATKGRKQAVILSDDEEDASVRVLNARAVRLDSESESREAELSDNESQLINTKYRNRLLQAEDSDDEDKLTEAISESLESQNNQVKSTYIYNKDIYDTAISDDEFPTHSAAQSDSECSEEHTDNRKHKISKKNKRSNVLKEKKNEKMEIFSTAQKMIRETEICLPYHKPKQRTLTEFLNRKKLSPICKQRRSLKMSMKDETLLREIEERRKDIDRFYKSESEEEEELSTGKKGDSEEDQILLDANEEDSDKWNIEKEDEVFFKDDSEGTLIERILKQTAAVVGSDTDRNTNIAHLPGMTEKKLNGPKTDTEMLGLDTDLGAVSKIEGTAKAVDPQLESAIADAEFNPSNVRTSSGSVVVVDEVEERTNQQISKDSFDKNYIIREKAAPPYQDEGSDQDLVGVGTHEQENLPACLEDAEMNAILNYSSDDSQDFRLHLDTEDVDEQNFNESLTLEASRKNSHLSQDLKVSMADVLCKNSHVNSQLDRTPKYNLLASKLPEFDLKNIVSTTPIIGGNQHGEFIEFEDVANETSSTTPELKEGVSLLLSRFVQHSNTKRKPAEAHEMSLNVISKEKNESGEEKLISSNVVVTIKPEVENGSKESVPGACLVNLKNVLKAKLLKLREKECQRREKEKQFLDSEEVIQDYADDLPDEEQELSDHSDTEYETESEPEEDDIIIEDKKKKKSVFVDEEAEESDEDGTCSKDENEEENENDVRKITQIQSIESSDEDSEDSVAGIALKKAVKRIIDGDDDDDDAADTCTKYKDDEELASEDLSLKLQLSESVEYSSSQTQNTNVTLSRTSTEDLFSSQLEENILKRAGTGASVDTSFELVGSLIPGHQPGGGMQKKTQNDSFVDDDNAALSLFSRVDNLTESKTTEDSKRQKSFGLILTPMKDSQLTPVNGNSSRNLMNSFLNLPLAYSDNIQDTQEILGLCSRNFAEERPAEVAELCTDEDFPATQDINDLVGLCSGKFTSQMEQNKTLQAGTDHSKDVTAHLHEKSRSGFSEDFETYRKPTEEALTPKVGDEPRAKSLVEVYSSDEEGILHRQEKNNEKKRRKIRKRKRIIAVSDNEDDASYDSLASISEDEEEKELIIKEKFTGFKDAIRGGIRSDFLEKEAELSGSEEGSDDEEEPNEDEDFMEQEEGDTEKFDEEQLRNEVGRAHMKSMIDSDKRELRLLQEMYLEDGDLHGQGRQRKFRWKNLNVAVADDDDDDRTSDKEYDDDGVEEEAEWRKQRFEREKFIREQDGATGKVGSDVQLPRSSSLKMVRNLSKNHTTPLQPCDSEPLQNSALTLLNLSVSTKRGSFLKRDKSSLKKLADFTKENETVGGAKQGGNFVFRTLTADEVEQNVKKETKIKSVKPALKKCRLERSFFSMDEDSQKMSIFQYL